MKRRSATSITVGVFIIASICALFSTCLYRSFTTTGQLAIESMNPEERVAFAKLSSVTHEMNVSQVYETLGPPSEDIYFLAKWNAFGGSIFSQARVHFLDGHPSKIRWLKLGFFMYEKTL